MSVVLKRFFSQSDDINGKINLIKRSKFRLMTYLIEALWNGRPTRLQSSQNSAPESIVPVYYFCDVDSIFSASKFMTIGISYLVDKTL